MTPTELAKVQEEIARLEAQIDLVAHLKLTSYFPDCLPACKADSPNLADHVPQFGRPLPTCRVLYPKHLGLFKGGATYQERLFLKANRVGGTDAAAYETTCHLTGLYPPWWEGKRFEEPIEAWVSGETTVTTRDIIQVALLGPIETVDTGQWSGMIPGHLVADVRRKQGIPNAVETMWVTHRERHHGAPCTSTLQFKSYDQRRESFQGTTEHLIWLDEEPPAEIYTECLLRTMATGAFAGGLILVTFMPIQGLTLFTKEFLESADFLSTTGEIRPARDRFWSEVGAKEPAA